MTLGERIRLGRLRRVREWVHGSQGGRATTMHQCGRATAAAPVDA